MPTNAIVIGGTSLSRGYTLEGLSVSYFLRNTVFYDTLMQMGRWFGYRQGYEDLCKIFLPESSIDSFAQIIEATEDLIDDLKRMAKAKMTPYDFGLAVKHHPDSGLQVTARNKQKNAKDIYFDMKLDGLSVLDEDLFEKLVGGLACLDVGVRNEIAIWTFLALVPANAESLCFLSPRNN